jgi:hypothetical protein
MILLEQAERAERLARGLLDAPTCEALLRYARECREKIATYSSESPNPAARPEVVWR